MSNTTDNPARQPTDDPEDDELLEDLDDLDDLLPTFTQPLHPRPNPTASSSSTHEPTLPTSPSSQPTGPFTASNLKTRGESDMKAKDEFDSGMHGEMDLDLDFEAELTKGMESLLKELGMSSAGSTGVGAGQAGSGSALASGSGSGPGPGPGSAGVKGNNHPGSTSDPLTALSDLDEQGSTDLQAFLSKLLEDGGMEGIPGKDLGFDFDSLGFGQGTDACPGGSGGKGQSAGGVKRETLSFQESVERTMKGLKEGAEGARKPQSSSTDDPLSALLARLTSDPSALAALEGLGGLGGLDGLDGDADADADADAEGGEGMGNVLDGMMRQLMTREILMEPLEELADKYPAYLASQQNHPTIPPTQLSSYTEQSRIITQILQLFRSPGYTDEDEDKRKEVYGLMVRMQEMGNPPEEVMGDEMPDGLGFGGDEGCTIM